MASLCAAHRPPPRPSMTACRMSRSKTEEPPTPSTWNHYSAASRKETTAPNSSSRGCGPALINTTVADWLSSHVACLLLDTLAFYAVSARLLWIDEAVPRVPRLGFVGAGEEKHGNKQESLCISVWATPTKEHDSDDLLQLVPIARFRWLT